jgi:hypothetical protein
MKNISYASTVDSLLYAQVCTRPDIAMAIGMLGRYLSNPGLGTLESCKESHVVFARNQGLQFGIQAH